MNRREFAALLSGAVASTPLLAVAQQSKRLPAVVLVFVTLRNVGGPQRAFVDELGKLGWTRGHTVVIDVRSLEGDSERAPALFADLLGQGVDVIALGGARWLHDAALKAVPATPIVTLFQDDPVASGLIGSLGRPGGHLTGIAQTTGPEFYSKRLQFLKELAPNITRVAFVAPRSVLEQDRNAPRPEGVNVIPIALDVDRELDDAFTSVRREKVDALMVGSSAIAYGNAQRFVAFAAENKLPSMHATREAVDVGGLISYATSVPDIFRQMARLTDKILRGAKPADLPVEQSTRFELVINAPAAKSLGLTIPPTLLALADDVVE
jgi:putative tryptophan/tyrosine transport system substrate-binding protein